MGYKDPTKQREYQRLWRAKRRADFFLDKKCVECGSRENLELDHTDRSKKVSHRIWTWSKKRRLLEISKCQILCEACHKLKTTEELYGHFVTTTEYFCTFCKTMLDKSLFVKEGNRNRPHECKLCKSKRNKLRIR